MSDEDLNEWGVQFIYNVGQELGEKVTDAMTLDEAMEHFQKYALNEQQMDWIKTYLEEQFNKPYWA
jgi:hypothetical protein